MEAGVVVVVVDVVVVEVDVDVGAVVVRAPCDDDVVGVGVVTA